MATIVAITSCPTGIAHTYMAAEGLEAGAKKLGHKIKVETQGNLWYFDYNRQNSGQQSRHTSKSKGLR